MSTDAPRPSATVVVVRPASQGMEVLLLRRSAQSRFLPHAWVFPGGAVEATDREVPVVGALASLPPDQRVLAVAAVRECFEETGIWLGLGTPPASLRQDLNTHRVTLDTVPALSVDLDRLCLWSRWITPIQEPRRYDTLFFLAVVDAHQDAHHDDHELVSSAWLTPAEALQRAHIPDFFIVPPTWHTLADLARLRTVAALCRAATDRPVFPLLPRREVDEQGNMVIVLPGDPSYPAPHPGPEPRRLVLDHGRWRSGG